MAEIETLKRVIARANNSLFGSDGFESHLANKIEELQDFARKGVLNDEHLTETLEEIANLTGTYTHVAIAAVDKARSALIAKNAPTTYRKPSAQPIRRTAMTLEEALQIILQLARQTMANKVNKTEEEFDRQLEAYNMVETLRVQHLLETKGLDTPRNPE